MIRGMVHKTHKPEGSQPFRTCGSCKKRWTDWQHFLHDSGVRLLGLQASPQLTAANLLVFEHRCGSTISILASRLRHLLPASTDGQSVPRYYGSDVCRDHCTRLEDLEACDRPCANAVDRRLIQLLIEMKKSRASGS